jgi:hypothetical protein
MKVDKISKLILDHSDHLSYDITDDITDTLKTSREMI